MCSIWSGHITCVDSDVVFEVPSCCESLFTAFFLTFKWFFSCVSSYMDSQPLGCVKCLQAAIRCTCILPFTTKNKKQKKQTWKFNFERFLNDYPFIFSEIVDYKSSDANKTISWLFYSWLTNLRLLITRVVLSLYLK